MRKLQIGVMGSAADLNYERELERLAEEVGEYVAKSDSVLLFGAEKDYDSLSTAACRGAKKYGGLTIGITYEKGKDIYMPENADVIVCTGLVRGGGRELVLSLSCDSMIAINGGSGTLTELAIAYQASIPTVLIRGIGGWSDKLAYVNEQFGNYFDSRRQIVYEARTPKEAVDLAVELGREYLARFEKR